MFLLDKGFMLYNCLLNEQYIMTGGVLEEGGLNKRPQTLQP